MLTQSEIRIIKNLIAVRSDLEIAKIIGKSVGEVHQEVSRIAGVAIQSTHNRKLPEERHTLREEKYQQRLAKNRAKAAARNQERQEQRQEAINVRNQIAEQRRLQREEKKQRRLAEQEKRKQEKLEKKQRLKINRCPDNAFSKNSMTVPAIKQPNRSGRPPKRAEPKFLSKNTDYSKLRLIRIDRTTFIYISLTADAEKERERYLSMHTK